MKVRDVLKAKGHEVHLIGEEQPLLMAVSLLNRHRIGALLVTDPQGGIAGILSERDIMRQLHAGGGCLGGGQVKDLMTPKEKLVVATEDDDLDYVMQAMTKNRVRHLPVVGGGRLVGVLSIGDIVNCELSGVAHENKMLQDYISGRYPA